MPIGPVLTRWRPFSVFCLTWSCVQVAKPGAHTLCERSFTHEWKTEDSVRGYHCVVDAATLEALRQGGHDAFVCVGVAVTAVTAS